MSRRRKKKGHSPIAQPDAAGHSNGATPAKTGIPSTERQPGTGKLASVLMHFNRLKQPGATAG